MLLDGSGELPPEQADVIIGNLAQSTPTGPTGTRSASASPRTVCRAGRGQAGLVLLLERRQPTARDHGRDRRRPPLRDGHRLAGPRPTPRRARPSPGRHDDVPRRKDLAVPSSSRSGRRSRVRAHTLFPPPRLDLGVVIRTAGPPAHRGPASWRPSVARALEQVPLPSANRLGATAGLPEHVGHQPHDRLDHHQRRGLPAGQHVVADGAPLRRASGARRRRRRAGRCPRSGRRRTPGASRRPSAARRPG